jgi:hypothetical protein
MNLTMALSVGLTALCALSACAWEPAPGKAQWMDVDGISIPVPPSEHPRLYLRSEHVANLKARLEHPVLQPVVERLKSLAGRSRPHQLEWNALQYLVTRDESLGRATVADALDYLKATQLADKQDACRATGRAMVTGAIVYDWLYPLIDVDTKQQFVTEFVRLAKTQECGYPPTRQGSVTGHSSEAMIMRDMISAGIAIYDEFPEMYRLSAGRFFRAHLPARNWLYEGHAYHQGDSYGPYRYSADTFPLWIFDRLGAGDVYNPQQQYVPYLYLYTTRPDGQRLRSGDTFSHSAPRGRPWGFGVGALLTASYYGDGYTLSHALAQGGVGDGEAIFEFLWRDPDLTPKPATDLPLSRYFGGPFGWMVARTGWGEDAVIAEMKVNVYNFANHQHMDAGAFQLYYKGALAADTGRYSGSSGAYGSPHCRNYYWRTIAHNSLLVYDPKEAFSTSPDWGNDGGQRLPNGRSEPATLEALLDPAKGYKTGEVLAHGFGPDARSPAYTYLKGDLTSAYSAKVKQVVRSFVFLNLHQAEVPAALVVYDRVVSADPSFREYWLLHSLEEPQVSGSNAVIDRAEFDSRGRLNLTVLLPEPQNLELSKVGGPGKEFWVFGQNFANDVSAEQLQKSSQEAGAWRLEISPRTPAAENHFLNVMQVTDRLSGKSLPVRRIDGEGVVGCQIGDSDDSRVVLFRMDAARSDKSLRFTIPGTGLVHVLVTDLTPGTWHARPDVASAVSKATVSAEEGAAWFAGPAGLWTVTKG